MIMTNYTQDNINKLNEGQKVELYNEFSSQLNEQMWDFGSNSGHPTFMDEDSCVISNEFKCLYITESFIEDINKLD